MCTPPPPRPRRLRKRPRTPSRHRKRAIVPGAQRRRSRAIATSARCEHLRRSRSPTSAQHDNDAPSSASRIQRMLGWFPETLRPSRRGCPARGTDEGVYASGEPRRLHLPVSSSTQAAQSLSTSDRLGTSLDYALHAIASGVPRLLTKYTECKRGRGSAGMMQHINA